MVRLRFKTRGESEPRGKARVFLAVASGDYLQHLEGLAESILQRQDCALWYLDPCEHVVDADREDFELQLSQMGLVVVCVTRRLLQGGNAAADLVVPYALANHISVLPILGEPATASLLQGYGPHFGNLQYLDPNSADPTQLPYEAKLTRYLSDVLVGEEEAAQVRDAFDAYIFMSYRKKDRREAQELMRLIHRDPACRRVAIWYDEYLEPGEDFTDSIRDSLNKSEVFALVVTPNLLERPEGRPNYVMANEYPAARRSGKPILAVEMQPTDRLKLQGEYVGLGDPMQPDATEEIRSFVMSHTPNTMRRFGGSSLRRDYLTGLAYLDGIDVEVDHERAVRLITGAAEQGNPLAIRKLCMMYTEGKGVERDTHKAMEWHQRLIDFAEYCYEREPSLQSCAVLYTELMRRAMLLYQFGLYEEPRPYLERALELVQSASSRGVLDDERASLYSFWVMSSPVMGGEAYLAEHPEAVSDVVRLTGKLYGDGIPEFASVYSLLVAGNRLQDSGQYEQALDVSKTAVEVLENSTFASRNDYLPMLLLEAAVLCRELERPDEALHYCERGIEALGYSSDGESPGTVASGATLVSLLAIKGDALRMLDRPEDALRDYKQVAQRGKELLAEADGRFDLCVTTALASWNSGDLLQELGYPAESVPWFWEAYELCHPLVNALNEDESLAASIETFGPIGEFLEVVAEVLDSSRGALAALGYGSQALQSLDRDRVAVSRLVLRETGTPDDRRFLATALDDLGQTVLSGDADEALSLFEEEAETLEPLGGPDGELDDRRGLGRSLGMVGAMFMDLGISSEALQVYGKAVEICYSLAYETGEREDYQLLGYTLYSCAGALESLGREDEARLCRLEASRVSPE